MTSAGGVDSGRAVGNCGAPPRDQSRTIALIGITLTVGAWLIVPAVVAIAFAL